MLRTTWLSAQNEIRLLAKDPVVLLMLLLAPVVIIAVAGYSLGAIYGGAARVRVLPVVDHDGGEAATRLVAALQAESSVRVETLSDDGAARRLVARADGPPLAIEIPAGTTAAIRQGRSPRLVLYVDPAKRIETNALELRLAELCRRAVEDAQTSAQERLDQAAADLRREIAGIERALRERRARVRTEIAAARATTGRRIAAEIRAREERVWRALESKLSERGARLDDLRARLRDLQSSEAAFEDWLVHVRELAGRHAADLPPPPALPSLPSDAELAALAEPIVLPAVDQGMPVPAVPVSAIATSRIDPPDDSIALGRLDDLRFDPLPGVLGFTEVPASPGANVTVNAFDQYVPGFGVTFLLIGMMLGIALTLFDERDWGTLHRLGASGVPLPGLLLGKLLTRFTVGVAQMAVLFTVGRALFGISLGSAPLALLLPTVGISFAAAALGLIVSALARSHDAVMPLGTMLSMAMSAIGGCWWPLGFEPPWMRYVALGLPTTWAMRAYNDLMIRRVPWEAALWPMVVTMGLGCVYLVVGIAANVRRAGG